MIRGLAGLALEKVREEGCDPVSKHKLYLATSVIILATVLGLAQVASVMRERQGDLLLQLEAERERSDRLERKNAELLETLQNRTSAPARGGRLEGWESVPVTQPSGLTAAALERAFAGTGLAGLGEALVQAETATGVSALVLAAICAHESGWGSSRLARDKNNLAGLGAYPGEEYSAGIMFSSRAGSIMFLARLLAVDYAPGGKHFGGSHDLAGIGVRYASDPGWAAKVAGAMRVIVEGGGANGQGN